MISDYFISLVSEFPAIPATFLLGTLPVLEIRGALPVGLLLYDLPWASAYTSAVLGNILPIFPLYAFLYALKDLTVRVHPRLGHFFESYTKRAHRKLKERYDLYGFFALFLFTAIPFPLTGVYTATVGAILLDIPIKKSLPALSLGVLCSGLIVTLLVRIGFTVL